MSHRINVPGGSGRSAFIAGGVGGLADWPRAVNSLREAAGDDRQAAAQLQLIEAMNLGPAGEPAPGPER